MRVVLLYPRWTGTYGIFSHFAKRSSIWPPLGLAYLAAIAEEKGHVVKIIDGEAENVSADEMARQVNNFKPDIVGITASSPFYHIAIEIARGIKRNNSTVPVIIGGTHITVLKEKAFNDFFDYAFIGESERSWSMFLDYYEAGKDISGIKGLIYRRGREIIFTGMPEHIENIDSLPFPARHLLKVEKYNLGMMRGRKNFTTIMTSRGCPFRCIFCSTEAFGHHTRRRPVQSVINEMKSVISEFNIRHFNILDETLTLDRNYILELCSAIEKEKLLITFDGGTRANLVDEELISIMAKSGLIRIAFGLESVNSRTREIIKKEIPLECYSKANKLTNKYKIETLNSVILGLPGETRQTAEESLNYLENVREIHQVSISIAVPYPGTELYNMAKKGEHGLRLLSEDFSKYRRYGSAVMEVNDLSAQDLIELQNDGFVRMYSAPWRILPMLKKQGLLGGVLMIFRLVNKIIRKYFRR